MARHTSPRMTFEEQMKVHKYLTSLKTAEPKAQKFTNLNTMTTVINETLGLTMSSNQVNRQIKDSGFQPSDFISSAGKSVFVTRITNLEKQVRDNTDRIKMLEELILNK